ncbi:MAG: nuclear transport factor 2 family protein [Chitinophagaceae bacterium]|nr:MAG: nuclear transport factor 2 family protein [Chitinophagaceae bacterium]
MKTFLVGLFALLTLGTSAQKKALNDVKYALEVLRLAMISGDKGQLMQTTTPGLSYGHSSGLVETQEQFAEKLASGKSDFVSISITNETIELYKNTAIVRHELNAETNDNGVPGTVRLKILLVWVQQGNGWQLAARQATKFP